MYVTGDEVRAMATQMTESSLSPEDLDVLIERASRIFDLICGVEPGWFEPAGASATARTVYGDGTNYLRLPPYVAGTLSSTITMPTGYTVPTFIAQNGHLVLTVNGVLPNAMTRPPSMYHTGWTEGVAVTVTAKWGYEAVPEDVKHAIIELVINLWRETDPAQLKLVNIEGQPLRERMPPRVQEIARRYRGKGVAFV